MTQQRDTKDSTKRHKRLNKETQKTQQMAKKRLNKEALYERLKRRMNASFVNNPLHIQAIIILDMN